MSLTHVPLRQLSSGDYDHWMLRQPGNIILEQGPHPIAQVLQILGPVSAVSVQVADRRQLPGGRLFYANWQISLTCARGTASVYLSFGREAAHHSLTALGQDGLIRAEFGASTYTLRRQTRYAEPVDTTLVALREAGALTSQGVRHLIGSVATLICRRRNDPFFQTMTGSIEAFYRALRRGESPPADGEQGTAVIECCERVIGCLPAELTLASCPPQRRKRPSTRSKALSTAAAVVAAEESPTTTFVPAKPRAAAGLSGPDTVVLGGTGFIGSHLVRRLVEQGCSVRVMARRPNNLPEKSSGSSVEVMAGDIRDPSAVR